MFLLEQDCRKGSVNTHPHSIESFPYGFTEHFLKHIHITGKKRHNLKENV
jgi:hypothetical protein